MGGPETGAGLDGDDLDVVLGGVTVEGGEEAGGVGRPACQVGQHRSGEALGGGGGGAELGPAGPVDDLPAGPGDQAPQLVGSGEVPLPPGSGALGGPADDISGRLGRHRLATLADRAARSRPLRHVPG